MSESGLVCARCGAYARESRSDGASTYTVCAYCGRPELRFKPQQQPKLELVQRRVGS